MKRALEFFQALMRPMSPENDWFPVVAVVVAGLAYGTLIGLLHLAPKRQHVPMTQPSTVEVCRP